MKKIIPAVLAAFCMTLFTGCSYNTLVAQREAVESQWANVENQYQKRADLVPNLVATVKGYAKHEEGILTSIAESRSKLGTNITLDSSITDNEEALAKYQAQQAQLGASLSRLLSITEAYPELKADKNFMDLQSQLEGIENRISTERKRYNDAVRSYNTAISRFPAVISAKMFHFEKKAYFKADETAKTVPAVSFD